VRQRFTPISTVFHPPVFLPFVFLLSTSRAGTRQLSRSRVSKEAVKSTAKIILIKKFEPIVGIPQVGIVTGEEKAPAFTRALKI
jgi:hypothetical protein